MNSKYTVLTLDDSQFYIVKDERFREKRQSLCPFCRPKKEKVKFQWHLKDNTNLELPLKKIGLENVFKWENNDY